MYPLYLFILALIVATIKIVSSKTAQSTKQKMATFLKSIIFFNIGVMGLLGYFAHTFMPDETAKSIGWYTGSPFQFEVAVSNLSFSYGKSTKDEV